MRIPHWHPSSLPHRTPTSSYHKLGALLRGGRLRLLGTLLVELPEAQADAGRVLQELLAALAHALWWPERGGLDINQ
jgi:hypothetical protein